MDVSFVLTHLLSFLLAIPVAGALVVMFLPRGADRLVRIVTLAVTILDLLLGVLLFFYWPAGSGDFQYVEYVGWITEFNVAYHLGIDGIALLLIGLTLLTMPVAVLASWSSVAKRVKEYHVLLLILQTGVIGVFASLDTVLFYFFWEIILIPMYFIIGIWGGERRIYASVKFFLFTIVGSLLMLVAVLWMGMHTGHGFTSDYISLVHDAPLFSADAQRWLFLAFALAFLIKVPLFPFHTWLPDAHTEAPTAGSVILAGLLLKMGTFGLIRYNLVLFPKAALAFAPTIGTLAIVGIVYGALVSMVQPDMKRLIAYSSVSHLGFVVLGLFSMTIEGMQGAVIQMVNHGLSTGMLFLLVGVIYDRRHTRMIAEYGGLARVMPRYAAIFAIAMLSSVGLPGLNGFVGEFLILLGTFQSFVFNSWTYAFVAASGVIFAALYLLGMYKRVFFGPVTNEKNAGLQDVSMREMIALASFAVFAVWIGVHPSSFMSFSESTVAAVM